MDLLTGSTALAAFLFTFLYYLLVNRYAFWERKGIKGPKPTLVFGNLGQFVFKKKSIGSITKEIYKDFKREKVAGIFTGLEPALLVCDFDIIKKVLIKDFDYFDDRGNVAAANSSLKTNLFSTDGPTWRVLRQKLSPVFTSGKLKAMYYLFQNCADKFDNYVNESVEKKTSHDVRDLSSKYTMEVICSSAFGIDANSINDEENIYRNIGMNFFRPDPIKLVFETMAPRLAKLLNITTVHRETEIFFKIMVEQLIAERQGKPKTRHDFMDLLIAMKEEGELIGTKTKDLNEISLEINNSVLESQAFVFFVAGFETSSSTMSFMLYEFALNPEVQELARKEVDKVHKKYGTFTYEALHEMEYLEMCMSETLRKYPIVDVLLRRCNYNYYFPELELSVEKGLQVLIPLQGFNYDPEIFPNPEKFDPERYSKENKAENPMLSFGDGPRNCIGKRFAKVQTLLGIATLLRKFIVVRSEKTQDVIRFTPDVFLLESADRIWVDLEKRTTAM